MVEMLPNEEALDRYLSVAPERDRKYIISIFNALDDGFIANARFNDAKDAVNRLIEKAYHSARQCLNEDEFWKLAISSYAHNFVGNVEKIIKAVQKRDGDATDAIEALRVYGPLAKAAVAAKKLAVKKAPALSDEEKKSQYIANASSGATKALHDRLIVEVKPYEARLADFYASTYDRYTKVAEKALQTLAVEFPSKVDAVVRSKDYIIRRADLLNNPMVAEIAVVIENEDSVADHRALYIERSVEEIIFHFVYKTCHKLKGVMENKGEFSDLSISTPSDFDLGVENTMVFNYSDGSSFTCDTSVVHVVNQFGTRFVRNPLNIRSAKFANGVSLKYPCLETLTEEWSKA